MANKIGAVGVLFTDSFCCEGEKPFKMGEKNRVYPAFSRSGAKFGLDVFYANSKEFKEGVLKRAWTYKNKRWIKVYNQELDIIYSRFAKTMFLNNKEQKRAINFKYKMAEKVSLINHPAIDKFCWDKSIISEFFPEYTPKTFLVNTIKGLKTVLPELKTDR